MTAPMLVPVATLVKEWGWPRQTIHSAIKRGDLRAVKYGRVTSVYRESADAFLAKHTVGRAS